MSYCTDREKEREGGYGDVAEEQRFEEARDDSSGSLEGVRLELLLEICNLFSPASDESPRSNKRRKSSQRIERDEKLSREEKNEKLKGSEMKRFIRPRGFIRFGQTLG